MHKHVGKCAKMHKSEESKTGGTKQARQAYQHHTKQRKVCIKHTNTTEVHLTSDYIQTNLRRDGCNHASPRGAQSMAKSRSREANMLVKRRSEQANIDMHKGNDPNPLM